MAEGARLRAVAVNLDRVAGERALDEARDHHSVAAALAWPDVMEEPHDDRVESALEVVREREVLVHRLRVGVEPALLGGRPVDAPIALHHEALLAVCAAHR